MVEADIVKKRKKDKKNKIIRKIKTERINGEIIGKICSSSYYTYDDTLIDDVADALQDEKDIHAIAVVDRDMGIKGILQRSHLFDTLSKPFGRDLFKNKPVSSIAEKVEEVNFTKNIFVVAQKYDGVINNSDISFFALINGDATYRGIFSSRDVLVYLSELTMKDIALAKNLQYSIVKKSATYTSERLEIVAGTKMAKGIGGDFYWAKKYSDTNWIVSLCDVSGKGISASLISVTLSGMFNIYDFTNGIPAFITAVNDYIYNSFESGKFVTGVFMDVNEETGRVCLFDMGHSYTYRYRDRRAERIDSPDINLPLGLVEGIQPGCKELSLDRDQLLISVSDGIEEQTNLQNEEYSVARFMNVLIKNIKEDYESLRSIIFSKIKDFRKGQAVQDDMTYVVVKRK